MWRTSAAEGASLKASTGKCNHRPHTHLSSSGGRWQPDGPSGCMLASIHPGWLPGIDCTCHLGADQRDECRCACSRGTCI